MGNSPKDDEAVLRKKKYDRAVMFALVNPDILHPKQDWERTQGREER